MAVIVCLCDSVGHLDLQLCALARFSGSTGENVKSPNRPKAEIALCGATVRSVTPLADWSLQGGVGRFGAGQN